MKKLNIKNRIKELNDYFVVKILAGEFEYCEKQDDKFYVKIRIDGEYEFKIWMYMGFDSLCSHSGIVGISFTNEEKEKVYELLKDRYSTVQKDIKLAEFEKMKQELGLN